MLPHVADIPELAAERGMPEKIAKELERLARARESRGLRKVTDAPHAVEQAALVADQVREEALWSLYRPRSTQIEWPWEDMQRIVGSVLAGDVQIVGARTGVGKTVFLMNVVDHLLRRTRPVKYLPFETPPAKLLKLLAAIRLGYDPRHVLRDEWADLPGEAFEGIQEEITSLTGRVYRDTLYWTPQGTLNVTQVLVEIERAHDCGCELVVIDHLHRIELEGRNQEQELRRMMRALKDKAEQLEIPLLCGGQLNRGERDVLKRHLPPLDTDLRGAGALEEEADTILGLYIPLRRDVTSKEMAAVRKGLSKVGPLVRRNTTGVRILKHRVDGELVGEDVFLRYDRGALTDLTYEPGAITKEANARG
jgi:replicative DNA helicase